jgi:ATP-dependent Lhr-like helicase
MDMCLSQRLIPEANLAGCLSDLALQLRNCLERHGAIFAAEFTRICGVSAAEVGRALWELVAAGLVTADGFDSLRILIDPRRKQSVTANASRSGPARNISGRWSLLCAASRYANPETAGQAAERREAELSSACRVLLRRYGVLFRDLLERESTLPKWRDLQPMLRRMEARGEVRGGRFLSGFSGEQFALPEALDSLREARRSSVPAAIPIQVAAADPLNLVGIVIPGERVSAVPGKYVIFDTAAVAEACAPMHGEALAPPSMFAPICETTPEAAR